MIQLTYNSYEISWDKTMMYYDYMFLKPTLRTQLTSMLLQHSFRLNSDFLAMPLLESDTHEARQAKIEK